jgi:hypothetical protein
MRTGIGVDRVERKVKRSGVVSVAKTALVPVLVPVLVILVAPMLKPVHNSEKKNPFIHLQIMLLKRPAGQSCGCLFAFAVYCCSDQEV